MLDAIIVKIVLPVISAVACSIATYYWTKYIHAKEEFERVERENQKALQKLIDICVKADCAMLRNTIRQACKNRIRDGFVEEDEREDIIHCYEVYEEFVPKNGYIDDCVGKFKALPSSPIQDKE